MYINDDIIIKDTDNIKKLRTKSLNVDLPLCDEDVQLCEAMIKYVEDSTIEEIAKRENLKPAVGISAIQIGINKNIFVAIIRDDKNNFIHRYCLVNPKIISESTQKSFLKSGEGCLSVIKNHKGYIYRNARIKIKAFNFITGKEEIIKADGYLSIVFQHEMDHLKGILYYDHINKSNPFYEIKDSICIE